jgi:hypothetical protein
MAEDRLSLAAAILLGAVLFCVLTLLLMAGFAVPAKVAAVNLSRQLVRQHGLHTVTLLPVSRPERYPAGLFPAVDLRHDPQLPIERPDSGLVFPDLHQNQAGQKSTRMTRPEAQ